MTYSSTRAKNVLFKNNQLHWIDLLQKERKQDCAHVGHSHLEHHNHLQSYTPVQVLCDFKTITIWCILNGKLVVAGTVLLPLFF